MAVIQRSEFALALNQIASERGVDASVVLETIKKAILAAYRKDHPFEEEEEEKYEVSLDDSSGETRIIKEGEDITPPGFGRIAAQTAKQVLLQQIREREKDAVFSEYSKRLETVVSAHILRFQGPNIIVDIGRAEAVIPQDQKIHNESYYLNKKIPVYIMEITEDEKLKRQIIVSRTHPGLIEGLLKREVPEIASGNVVVKKIVREPGSRAKVAVYSEQSGIDPVGSCVGQRGVRIQAVIDALDGLEKIDVIQWNRDPQKFIANALSPAKEVEVELDEEEKIAHISAPKEELPLVIGREGQNVRLASKLTEFNLEVEGREEVEAEIAKAEEEKIDEEKKEEEEAGEKQDDKSSEAEDVKEEKEEEKQQEKPSTDPKEKETEEKDKKEA